MRLPTYSIALILAVASGSARASDLEPAALRDRLYNPAAGVMVVAHRACHAAAPSRGLTAPLPENSLAALERCIALGVDIVEIDVRRTQDGALVVMHDAKVNRTTTGKGKVANLTLGELQALRLKAGDQVSDAAPPTLCAFLKAARGRILVNLDLKDPALANMAARVVRDVGAEDWVLFKARVEADAGPSADRPVYKNLAFMPIVAGKRADQLSDMTTAQASGVQPIPAVELDAWKTGDLAAVRHAARTARIRVWANALKDKDVRGSTDRDAREAWGGLITEGASIVQTDHPAALLDYLSGQGLRGHAGFAVADASTPTLDAPSSSR